MDAAGEAADLSIGLADIFGGEIDFNTDLQPADRFELLVEKQYRDEAFSFQLSAVSFQRSTTDCQRYAGS